MADYFMHDNLSELWQQINQLHLTYLDTEDSPQKIEQRNRLEACIREYLCLAPHNRKFYCLETAEVLRRSASSKKDFSGYRAAVGWNAISIYAGNLLSQPWRKEYQTIKMYSGFYKHQIEANLAGAEAMFEAMGYKYVGNGVLVLEGPVCPDRVTNVSQDSIVAFVECQILKTIWEEVGNNFKVSWWEVLEFRESHLCSPEQSIKTFNYRFHERRYQEQQNGNYSTATESYSTVPKYSMSVNQSGLPSADAIHSSHTTHSTHVPHGSLHPAMAHPGVTSQLTGHSAGTELYSTVPKYSVSVNQSGLPPVEALHASHTVHSIHTPHSALHPTITHPGINPHQITGHSSINQQMPLAHMDHSHMDNYRHMHSHYAPIGHLPCTAQCICRNPYYNYNTYAPVMPNFPAYGTIPYPMCASKACNGYCYPNGCVPPPVYMPVPTGKLIELENSQNGIYDTPDGIKRQQDYLESHKQLAKSTNLDSLTLSKSKEDGTGTFESWDYVYRSLESQGYNKDLGDRGDVLQSDTRKKREKKAKPSIELEDALNSLNLSSGTSNTESNLRVSEGIKRFTESSKPEPKVPQSTSYDSIAENHRKSISNGISKTKTLPREKPTIISPEKPSQTLDTKKLKKDSDKMKLNKNKRRSSSWNCNTCTYLNSPSVEICIICGKSKRAVDVPMAVGGSQCPRCTLINPKECTMCQACDTSLLDSPTYI